MAFFVATSADCSTSAVARRCIRQRHLTHCFLTTIIILSFSFLRYTFRQTAVLPSHCQHLGCTMSLSHAWFIFSKQVPTPLHFSPVR